jgi:hypothetical protein
MLRLNNSFAISGRVSESGSGSTAIKKIKHHRLNTTQDKNSIR